MIKDNGQQKPAQRSLPRAFSHDLRGRQSVRATFKLTEGCINAIHIVAAHMGIKQKSLFDHLMEDIQTLSLIAEQLPNFRLSPAGRIQKTFVLSRRSLISLEEIASSFNAPRDVLIELSVRRLLPVIAEVRKNHVKRKKTLKGIEEHLAGGAALLDRIGHELGKDDAVHQELATVMAHYAQAVENIKALVARGRAIEDFDEEILKKQMPAHGDREPS
ncbi:MAG: hypothetical protein LJE63_08650 [Desulfobacteraceae bacterium]|jgi:hypothetical protein|nr:hypothetical protein [Desulfobacteraceae bacterium]